MVVRSQGGGPSGVGPSTLGEAGDGRSTTTEASRPLYVDRLVIDRRTQREAIGRLLGTFEPASERPVDVVSDTSGGIRHFCRELVSGRG